MFNNRYPPSLIFDITSMALRLIPRGEKRTYTDGKTLFRLFLILYKDVHPNVSYPEFMNLIKEIFPLYKNPRKATRRIKISIHELDKRLESIGVNNFPIDTLIDKENLRIEM